MTTIGRLPDRELVLSDPQVSRRHAEIRRAVSGFVLVDCDSTNGVVLNGESVSHAVLGDGDVIGVGDTVLRFVIGR